MNKAELATEVAKRTKISQKVAKVAVDVVFEEMVNALKKGERIEIRGFGSFAIRHYEGY